MQATRGDPTLQQGGEIETLVAGAELEAGALGRHAPAVQIGQQTEERYRQRDVRTRDALGRAVAGGDCT